MMTIGRKLYCAFFLMTLTVLAVGVTGVVSLLELKALETGQYQTNSAALAQLVPLTQSLVKMRVVVQDMLLSGKSEELPQYQKDLDILRNDFDTQLRSYFDKLSKENGTTQYDALVEKYSPFKNLINSVFFQVSLGQVQQAASVWKGEGKPILDALDQQMISFVGFNEAQTHNALVMGSGTIDQAIFLCIIISIFAVLISIFCALILNKSLSKPLFSASTISTKLAGGDLTVRFDKKITDRKDEIGSLARSINGLGESLSIHITTISQAGAEIKASAQILDQKASVVAQVGGRINGAVENGNGLAIQQSSGVQETAATIQQILKNIEYLDQLISEQSASVIQTSSSLEQMASNTGSIVSSTEHLGTAFNTLKLTSDKGKQEFLEVLERIEAIALQSQKMEEANSIIRGIASQTNLLSMNAAIEAAHAQESGKGFSVVAEEIRKLSDLSNSQSAEIAKEIEIMKGQIEAVMKVSKGSKEAFEAIEDNIGSLGDHQSQIREAMTQQELGTQEILKATTKVSSTTSEVRAGSSQMLEGSRAIAQEMERILLSAQSLRETLNIILQGVSEISLASADVLDESKRNKDLSQQLESVVGVFQLKHEA